MTHKIFLSTMVRAGIPDVRAEVEKHSRDMKDWLERKRLVDSLEPLPPRPEWGDFAKSPQPAEEYAAEMDKWNRLVRSRPAIYPAPIHHLDIASAVNENGEPDFELIDDSPTPEEVLVAKKNALSAQLAVAERIALESITPARKRRLFSILERDVKSADADRVNNLMKRLQSKSLASEEADTIREKITNPELLLADRPREHQQFMREQAARQTRCDEIARLAAQASSDIEDLTVENIDSYQIPDFQ